MTPLTRLLAALLSALLAAAMLTAPGTAASVAPAGPLEITCTPPSGNIATFTPPLTLTPQTVTVANSATYSPCVSATQPAVTSGTRSNLNTQTRSCLDLLTSGTVTFTITWNTGQTSTVSGTTTTSTAGAAIVFTTTGTVTTGLFAGSSVAQVNTAPSADILLCTAGLGTVSGVTSLVTLTIT
ncbi:hypothetical protein [Rhizohabitans arisaemae]|uniref:hypothetical protein n=1 Tax=Rhizohabitans arisaemae TaxID=2720610 RepID=UPI0024B063F2|nr:hypothetical protein [Rhizohabitans arisaemae]